MIYSFTASFLICIFNFSKVRDNRTGEDLNILLLLLLHAPTVLLKLPETYLPPSTAFDSHCWLLAQVPFCTWKKKKIYVLFKYNQDVSL